MSQVEYALYISEIPAVESCSGRRAVMVGYGGQAGQDSNVADNSSTTKSAHTVLYRVVQHNWTDFDFE